MFESLCRNKLIFENLILSNHFKSMSGKEITNPYSCESEKEEISSKFSIISFFSGCGGLDLGFKGGFYYKDQFYEPNPFDIVQAYEFDKLSIETYKKNIGDHVSLEDLSKSNVKTMPKANVLIGGFPCQEFSLCGPRRGIKSERGGLFRIMSKYAKFHKPAIVVAENVANLIGLNSGSELEVIRRSFALAGYRMKIWKVFAPDYGIPQARLRVFLFFTRSDFPIAPEQPKGLFVGNARSVKWAISDLQKNNTIANQDQFFKAAVAGKGHGQGDEISPENAPGYTVRANTRSRVQFHYQLNRRLTVRECARLQTFPDDFIFPHTATPNMKQIGNAVPPVLAHIVAKEVASYLNLQASRF